MYTERRKIKFRSWDLNWGERADHWKRYNERMSYDPLFWDGCNSDYTCSVNDNNQGFDDPQYVWMQFTGVKDKAQKEIYEGDFEINNGFTWIVKYIGTSFVLVDKSGQRIAALDADTFTFVAGNIYENPEMIK